MEKVTAHMIPMRYFKTASLSKKIDKLIMMVGISLLALVVYEYVLQPQSRLSFTQAPPPHVRVGNSSNTPALPNTLVIPDLELSLPVEAGFIDNNVWSVSEAGISHLNTSAHPGEVGNVVLYGHDSPDILGRLETLQPGSKIVVVTADGRSFTYVVEHSFVTTPDNIEAIMPTDEARLTVYTCTGAFNTKRLIVQAVPA